MMWEVMTLVSGHNLPGAYIAPKSPLPGHTYTSIIYAENEAIK